MPAILSIALSLCAATIQQMDTDYARRCVELGWEDRFDSDQNWRTETWLTSQPDNKAESTFDKQGGLFSVSAGRAMAWTRTTTPVWVDAFPWLVVDYQYADSASDGEATILVNDDATGPITPGALNPENPAASGNQMQVKLPAASERLVLDLRGQYKSDRAARITLLMRGAAKPLKLRVQRIAFWAADPRQSPQDPTSAPTGPSLLTLDGPTSQPAPGEWQNINLPADHTVSAEWLRRAYAMPLDWPDGNGLRVTGIPFRPAPAERAAMATGVQESASLEIKGQWKGSELALLLGTRVFGSNQPWYSATSSKPRGAIESPHELCVRLEYQDGTRRTHFPWSVLRKDWAVERAPQACVVPLEPGKTLTRIRVVDKMDYGQVFLLAMSVNTSGKASLPPVAEKTVVPTTQRSCPEPTATVARRDKDSLVIENAWLRMVADVRTGLHVREFILRSAGRQVIAADKPVSLIEIHDAQNRSIRMTLQDLRIERQAASAVIHAVWTTDKGHGPEVRLKLEALDDGQLCLTPTVANAGESAWSGSLIYPQLAGCRISDQPTDCWYLLGTHSTILDHMPIKTEQAYGGAFPLQLMDLFAPAAGGGLGLRVRDIDLVPKTFRFQQDTAGAKMSVAFPHVNVPAKGTTELPPAILFCHAGDWHEAMERYTTEMRALTKSPAAKRMQDLFYCRRDYPLGGTGYLFNAAGRHYTPQDLIDESVRGFGGIDMIDISGWAYHEAIGRVGEYRTNDLGGLSELRRAVEAAHQKHVKVGLYFEGYLIDRRVLLAKEALPAWQLVDNKGKGKWWSGDMEFFACPGVAKWREELSKAVADVAAETGADAVYLDEFGFMDAGKECWSPDHGHSVPSNPLMEEQRMLAAVRKAIDRRTPNVGIYIEQVPCDALMASIDGAFNYGMSSFSKLPQHVTKLPMHRYVFPEVTTVEMVGHGIRPVPVREDDLHRCVFHGLAFWLKGRSESWYSSGFRDVARRAQGILKKYAAIIRSDRCEPLVSTLAEGVYANRFITPNAVIVTVYNARYSDVDGDLLETPLPASWHVRDLWSDRPVDLRRNGDRAVLRGHIEPHSVGVFLLEPGKE